MCHPQDQTDMPSENESPAHLEPFKSSIDQKDHKDWQKYQLSLSLKEHSMRSEAMLNYRLTKDYLRNHASKYDQDNLDDQEVARHLEMLISIASQVEHFSFESWREARKAKRFSNAALIMAAATFAINLPILSYALLNW
jgi:hypothetical protein